MTTSLFTTIPGLTLQIFGTAELEALLAATKRFGVEQIRFTPGGQLAVSGVKDADISELTAHLQRFMRPVVNQDMTILSCPGCTSCKYGIVDTGVMVNFLENLQFHAPLPARCKIGVAGCSRCCTMPFVRDIGLIPSPGGWTVIFGGSGGGQPRIGDTIGVHLCDQHAQQLVFKSLQLYCKLALPKQRTSRFIEKFGAEQFKQQLFQK
jgi:NAD(P)H-nitrite reductase large subunit